MISTESLKKEMGLVPPERSEDERSEPSRSGGGTNPMELAEPIDPEVESKAKHRQFSAAYKRRILELRRYREIVLFCLSKTVHCSRSEFGNIIANSARAKLAQGVLKGDLYVRRVLFGSNDTSVAARQRFSRLSAWMMLNQTEAHIVSQV
jgi:hypothetical protein